MAKLGFTIMAAIAAAVAATSCGANQDDLLTAEASPAATALAGKPRLLPGAIHSCGFIRNRFAFAQEMASAELPDCRPDCRVQRGADCNPRDENED